MTRTKNDILSIGAYLPLSVLPEGVIYDIMAELRRGFLKDFNFCDDNTELYFLKSEGASCDYAVTVTTVWSEEEPPETELIELGLTAEERAQVDELIIERMICSIAHNAEI